MLKKLRTILKTEIVLVAFILILAIFLRVFYLAEIPYRVDGDASQIALTSLNVFNNKLPLFSTGWGGAQNLFFFLNGFFIRFLEGGIFASRILPAIGGILSIITTYLLTKEMFDKKTALWASFFLTFLPIHLVFSRNGIDVIHVVWLVSLTLYLLHLGIKNNIYFLLVSGIILGFSQYFYHAARFIPILAIIYYFVFVIRKWSVKKIIFGLFLLTFSSVLTYGPMISYYYKNPINFYSRINQVSIFKSDLSIKEIHKHAINSFLVFFTDVDTTKFHYFANRYLPEIGSFLFALGLIIILFRVKKREYLILFLWFAIGITLSGILTIDSPQSARYVIHLPMSSIVMAVGLIWIFDKLKKQYKVLSYTTIILLYSLTTLYSYWTHETYDTWKFDTNTQVATFAGRYLSSRDNYDLYFMGDRNVYYPTVQFLTQRDGVDILQNDIYKTLEIHKETYIILLPNRQKQLQELKLKFPRGISKAFYNPRKEMLFWLFEIKNSSATKAR